MSVVITDGRERILAALEVDRRFADYEIEMGPDDAIQFLEVAPLAGAPSTVAVTGLVKSINEMIPLTDFGPDYPDTGKRHHRYRIGRERDRRLIKLLVFKGLFPIGYNYWELITGVQDLCRRAGSATDVDPAPEIYTVIIWWPDEMGAQP